RFTWSEAVGNSVDASLSAFQARGAAIASGSFVGTKSIFIARDNTNDNLGFALYGGSAILNDCVLVAPTAPPSAATPSPWHNAGTDGAITLNNCNVTNWWNATGGEVQKNFVLISNEVYFGEAAGLSNASPRIATNSATASDGQILSLTGGRLKWIDDGGGSALRTNQFTTNIDNTPVLGQLNLLGTNGYIPNIGARSAALEWNPMQKTLRIGSLANLGATAGLTDGVIPVSNSWDVAVASIGSIGLGSNSFVNAFYSSILGGINNNIRTNAGYSVIGGGTNNIIGSGAFGSVNGGGW